MPISNDDFDYLENRFDDRYRKIEDCDEIHDETDAELAQQKADFMLVKQSLDSIKKGIWLIFGAIVTGVIGGLLAYIGGLIVNG